MTALAKATVKTEDFAEETETDDGSGETKEVDLTAPTKATVETEAVHKKDSAEETVTDDGSGETNGVCLTAGAKA